ncbi:DUF222 domain-containing protein, partial [Antrihabitans cavernicola]
MFDTLPMRIPGDTSPGAAATEHISEMLVNRTQENVHAARTVHAAHLLWDTRMSEAADRDGDAGTAWNETVADVAVLLSMPYRSARELVEIGYDLQFRLGHVDYAFTAGDLGYPRVRTLCSVLRQASPETIAAIEDAALAAAEHLSPGPLRNQIWRLWMEHNPDEAAARESNQHASRTAYVRRGVDGLSWLSACITDLEGAEADRLIDEIANTVCADDPRERNTLRADGLIALLHGERILRCRCTQDSCPTAGIAIPERRKPLIQILIDINTLLGLTNTPATLADGTPLDPAVAQMIADDATWQAILTELRTLADSLGLTDTTDPARKPASDPEESDSTPESAAPPTFSYAEYLGRGRTHPAGTV